MDNKDKNLYSLVSGKAIYSGNIYNDSNPSLSKDTIAMWMKRDKNSILIRTYMYRIYDDTIYLSFPIISKLGTVELWVFDSSSM